MTEIIFFIFIVILVQLNIPYLSSTYHSFETFVESYAT